MAYKNGHPIRMLLIEDDVESAKSMRLMLQRRGVTVRHVLSGEEAIAIFNPADFNVVVSDIRLGAMSGVEVLRALRRDHPDFPFILLTAYDTLQTAIEAVRLGAQDYILKPLPDIETLIEPVNRAIGHSELIAENAALRDRLRRLASEILMVEENERHNLAGDLHDSVGQSLVVAKMKTEAALAAWPQDDRAAALQEIKGTLDEVIRQTRTLIFNISPPILYDLGLEAALDSLIVQVRRSEGLRISYRPGKVTALLGQELSVILFRATRELLSNTVKYARAKNIMIGLALNNGIVEIVVEDDGVGFDAEAVLSYTADRFGYGLFSIRERLKNYEGTMQIVSGKKEGTRVTLMVPVKTAVEGIEIT